MRLSTLLHEELQLGNSLLTVGHSADLNQGQYSGAEVTSKARTLGEMLEFSRHRPSAEHQSTPRHVQDQPSAAILCVHS